MTALARPKLRHLPQVDYVIADLLEYYANDPVACDAVVSTYAIHHLTAAEKETLLPASSPRCRRVDAPPSAISCFATQPPNRRCAPPTAPPA
ncbi:MAG: class I SAM-dependent methyltransferase [Caldilineaceae bacterium]|nr:class I SAM-dependent methyltransferase [Caldilineaceae bacterium]